MLRLDSFSAGVSYVSKFACLSSVRANTWRDPGFLLGWNSDSGYLCVSERKFHVFVSCGDWVTIAVIPVYKIADREVNLGEYLRVDSEIPLMRALEVRFLKVRPACRACAQQATV